MERPLGVDVAVEAFAFLRPLFAQHTFYRFTVTNRNAVPIDSAHIGFFGDFDLGDATDDYVGTDTTASCCTSTTPKKRMRPTESPPHLASSW